MKNYLQERKNYEKKYRTSDASGSIFSSFDSEAWEKFCSDNEKTITSYIYRTNSCLQSVAIFCNRIQQK